MKRKLKYNLSSTLLAAIVIALVVFFNIVASATLEKFPVKFDFSGNQLYSVSDETVQVLSALDKDVNIYYIVSSPAEGILQTLDMYKMHSGHINAEVHDPVNDPVFLRTIKAKGFDPSENDIIVECSDRIRLISGQSMYEWTEDEETGSAYASSFILEQHLTAAISYVSGDTDFKVAFTTGHGEQSFDTLSAILTNENITASKIDLKAQNIADDCLSLYIIGPQYDFSDAEINKISEFVSHGGSVAVCLDYKTASLPLLQQYLSQYWGVNFSGDIMAESSSSNTLGTPFNFYAQLADVDTVSGVSQNVLWSNSQSISLEYSYGVQYELLASSTETGVSMLPDGTILTQGQIPLAATLKKTNPDGTRSRMFVSGSHGIFSSEALSEASLGNRNFLYSAVKYLNRDEGSILSIAPKSLMVRSLAISDTLVTLYIVLFAVLPALLVLMTGFIVWMRRRHL